MAKTVDKSELKINEELCLLVRDEIAPGTGVNPDRFWKSFAEIVRDLGPKNRALLEKRNGLQRQIDQHYVARKDQPFRCEEYKVFLKEIGYLVPEGKNFKIATANVDPEITQIAGAQLVVPLDNARYALNAANARWGSLYDALYGTDAISETGGATRGGSYNPVRGNKVVQWTKRFLDEIAPLVSGSHAQVRGYAVQEGRLLVRLRD